MRVVLDTNVILSAMLFGGEPRQVLEAALAGSIRIAISESILAELQGVLQIPKFGFAAGVVQTIVTEMTSIAEWVSPKKYFALIPEDPPDNQVIDCAVATDADYIITGNPARLRTVVSFVEIDAGGSLCAEGHPRSSGFHSRLYI